MLRTILATLVLSATLINSGCTGNGNANGNRHRYLALGDSYTIGESVDARERWPNQLTSLLRRESVDVANPQIIATTGWTAGELLDGIDRAKPQGPFDLVTLLVGVNDQFRGRPAADFRSDFASVLRTAIELSGNQPEHVIVVSIPDWGVTPYADGRDRAKIAAEIDAFNALAAQEARVAGVAFVDVTGISRRAAGDLALLAPDGLHPSGAMYREWARLVLPVAKRALGAS